MIAGRKIEARMKLPSGKEIEAMGGGEYIGIDVSGETLGTCSGHDDAPTYEGRYVDDCDPEIRIELADYMIGLWTKYREVAERGEAIR
jgi:hypothetical protein